jgi:hypothetical protein
LNYILNPRTDILKCLVFDTKSITSSSCRNEKAFRHAE